MQAIVDFFAPRGPVDWVRKVVFIIAVIHILNLIIVPRIAPDTWSLRVELIKATLIPLPFVILALATISYLDNLQSKLAELATTDVLTGLSNRRAFFELADPALGDRGGTALMLDVDHFKRINDTYGHDVGDRCLRAVAGKLVEQNISDGLVARIGGEEFAALLLTGDPQVVSDFAEAFTNGIVVGDGAGDSIRLTLSVGAYQASRGESVGTALSRADKALYAAKRAGRARLVMWSAELENGRADNTGARHGPRNSDEAA